MKIKLFRIFTLVFVLASVVNLAFVPTSSADAASDQQAIGLITACKGKKGPFTADSDCAAYNSCLKSATTEICKSVKRLNGAVPALSAAALAGCKKAHQQADDCTTAFGNCIYFHVKSDKITAADSKKCTDLVAKGSLAEASKDPNAEKTTCVIQGIGWLICPVMTFLALIVDGAYLFVSSLLTVQPLLTDTSSSQNGIYQAWSIMRNFANVAFVIAFLVIIFSQVSSVGITNYGIKKLLPKLVVSAVLVNISYWLCAIAVDVSNIVGTSFSGLFDNIKATIAAPASADFFGAQGDGWEGLVGGVLAGTAAVGLLYLSLSALLPALVTVLLAIVVVFLVLTLRQALIILLIVVAPLAFVAYLLPNTESLFKKWRELFQTLLLMYPIIALIFGASALASKIVMTTAQGPYKIAIQIMGAAIAIIPLAITPIVMKTAGGLLNRFGGIINNPNKGPFDRLRKGAEGYRDYRKDRNKDRRLEAGGKILGGNGKILGGENSRRRKFAAMSRSVGATTALNREKKYAYAKTFEGEREQEYFANRAVSDGDFAKKMANGNTARAGGIQASAQAEVKKIFDSDVASREVLMRQDPSLMNEPEKALQAAIADGDKIGAVAAQNILYSSGAGGITKFRDAVQEAETSGDAKIEKGMDDVADVLKNNIKEKHGTYAKQKGADVLKWATAPPDQGKPLSETQFSAGDLNATELASQHAGSLLKMAQHGMITKEQALKVLNDQRIAGANMNEGKEAVLGNVGGKDPTPERLDIIHGEANEANARRSK